MLCLQTENNLFPPRLRIKGGSLKRYILAGAGGGARLAVSYIRFRVT